ncbi:putative beta-lactamase Bla2 [Leptospira inadai serovar Lyme str. 10]|uniref:beta-lactamase n=2 Tax=Leptospira inadai serovar Lyme TaxID=293084 RepID=V6HS25_9LEPT|nr:subclass B1 metallo-beta-lactamase [Leptospira inadai]EQA35364.1 putative beta-lactamase Bla2 [Leptospira inadai serovar Lyme str. 10]PNV71508.1 subclass B1 metallo-beta-lactamase [Leptospira inadai serovar Lyme]
MRIAIAIALLFPWQLGSDDLKIRVSPLTENFYVHTSYHIIDDLPFPSNGLIIATKSGAILIDTAWGNEQTVQILLWIKENLKMPVRLAILTHFHDDRAGGIQELKNRNIPSYANRRTIQKMKSLNLPVPDRLLKDEMNFRMDDLVFKVLYPGHGHTEDNIVVWFPVSKVLFGGCLVKSPQAKSLGNSRDANLVEWAKAIRSLERSFSNAKFVIPGHEAWGGPEAFRRTLELLSDNRF